MTTTAISARARQTDLTRWAPVRADLVFWTAVGGVVAALDRPLGNWWSVPHAVLLAGGLSFLVGGALLLFGLNRIRPLSRGLVLGCGVSNLLLAPTLWVAAALGWLSLSTAGNWALAGAGDAALVLGIWQLAASRRSR